MEASKLNTCKHGFTANPFVVTFHLSRNFHGQQSSAPRSTEKSCAERSGRVISKTSAYSEKRSSWFIRLVVLVLVLLLHVGNL